VSAVVETKRVIIVGAASGIGLACARRAVAEGAQVALLDRDDVGLARAFAELGSHAQTFTVDVIDGEALKRALLDAVDALGGLDSLMYCAGIDLEAPLAALDTATWERSLAVNLTGPMLAVQGTLDALKACGQATVVIVTSAAAILPVAGRSGYCAAKAGATMLAKALAMELAPDGIRVNAICPGAVDTPLLRLSWETKPDPEAALAAIAQRYALKRIASPEEIAAAVWWLSSEESSYVTGVALAVDGGRTFH
jgi:NAD(P)-dependent dehydrogenase (short-subunit alcohol dehydrogenase family)